MGVILYEHINFQGRHKHIANRNEPNLHTDGWGDQVSSIEVTSGTWRFHQHVNYGGTSRTLGPGSYSWVQSIGIPNDTISSIRQVGGGNVSTVSGGIILFEHSEYRGDHFHVWDRDMSNLHSSGWGDRASSAIVVAGEWEVFQHANFQGWSRALEPGMYPRLWQSGVGNDSVSSIRRRVRPNLGTSISTREAVLYEHIDYGGAHKHLVNQGTSNLHTDGWGDRVSSLQVLSGNFWTFHQHANYSGQQFASGVGNIRWLPQGVGFPNDQLSSVRARIVAVFVVEIEGSTTSIAGDFVSGNNVFSQYNIEIVNVRELDVVAPALIDLDQPACPLPPSPNPSDEEIALFAQARDVSPANIVSYYLRSTIPPNRGCSAYPVGFPGVVVADTATQWTLAHEIGHVLGLRHRNNTTHLMNNGTGAITANPPILTTADQTTVASSNFLV